MGIGPGTLSLLLADYLLKNGLIPQIIGSDINPLAVEVAHFNAELNHLEEYCMFLEGDLFFPLTS